MDNFDLTNHEGFPLTDSNLDHGNISGEFCFDEYNGKCLSKAAMILEQNYTNLEYDFEVFDERDLMNVIGYSMISIGKSYSYRC